MNKIITYLFFILCIDLFGYEIHEKNMFLRPELGANINVLRITDNNYYTPQALMVIGLQYEYVLIPQISIITGIKTDFVADFVGLEFIGGAKFRPFIFDFPLMPYVSIALTPAFLFPINGSDIHFNLGLRPSIGVDYFFIRDLALGLEVMFNPSVAFVANKTYAEVSTGVLLGFMCRI
jgi:hypothetical protein